MKQIAVSKGIAQRGSGGEFCSCRGLTMPPVRGVSLFLVFLFLQIDMVLGQVTLNTPQGISSEIYATNAGGGMDYLPSGDLLVFTAEYATGPKLLIVDANGDGSPKTPQVIQSYGPDVYASFVKVSPDGQFALLGLSGGQSVIKRLELKYQSYATSDLISMSGAFDLVFWGKTSVIVSANPGGFDPSQPNILFYVSLSQPSVKREIARFYGTPSGPLELGQDKSLYYSPSSWSFPAPAGSTRLLHFSASELTQAVDGRKVLDMDDGEVLTVLDAANDLAVGKSNGQGDIVYLASFSNGVLRYDTQTGELAEFLHSGNQAFEQTSFGSVALNNRSEGLLPCTENRARLAVAFSAYYYSEYYLAQVKGKFVDEDGDGSSDCEENTIGSDYQDRGSVPTTLRSPVYSIWNGYQGMTNILELSNTGQEPSQVTVTLFDRRGQSFRLPKFSLNPGKQQDTIINNVPGFQANEYGLIKIEFDRALDGRVLLYKGNSSFDDFSYVLVQPLSNPLFGEAAGSFNTFYPDSAKQNAGVVANWVTVVNLASAKKSFALGRFDQAGNPIGGWQLFTLRSGERRDLEAGHVNPGPGHVGQIVIKPQDAQAPWLGTVSRFGYEDLASESRFALSFPLRAGTGRQVVVLGSNELNATNWFEVINTENEPLRASLRCYQQSGEIALNRKVKLNARAQTHQRLDLIFPNKDDFGQCVVDADAKGRLIAQSLFYYPDSKGSGVSSLAGMAAQEALSTDLIGGYNLFLGMDSSVYLTNTSGVRQLVTLELYRSGRIFQRSYNVQAHSSLVLPLNESSVFQTQSNTYGLIKVRAAVRGVFQASSWRTRLSPISEDVQFRISTPVR